MSTNPSETLNTPPQNNAESEETGVTFSMDKNDPRRVDNRGGLDAVLPNEGIATAVMGGGQGSTDADSTGDAGTTGADTSSPRSGAADDIGATGSGTTNSGQVNLSTTGMVAPDAGPPGVGPVEGSQSGAVAPRVEVTDVGVVDLNTTDLGTLAEPTDGDEDTNA